MCMTFRLRSMIEIVCLGEIHKGWFPSWRRGMVPERKTRDGPRAGDEGLDKPIYLYESVGGEVMKF
jgi:hypothetical protein